MSRIIQIAETGGMAIEPPFWILFLDEEGRVGKFRQPQNNSKVKKERYVILNDLPQFTKISAGIFSFCGLDKNGMAWECEDTNYKKYGFSKNGDCRKENSTQIQRLFKNVKERITDIQKGGEYTLALTESGLVWAAGLDLEGEGTEGIQIEGLGGVLEIYAGYYHNFVKDKNKLFWGFGENDYGQLGVSISPNLPFINFENDEINEMPYRQVEVPFEIQKVATGRRSTIFLGSRGEVFWTGSRFSNFKKGKPDIQFVPVRVEGINDVVNVCSSWDFPYAVNNKGDIFKINGKSNNLSVLKNLDEGVIKLIFQGTDKFWDLTVIEKLIRQQIIGSFSL